MTPQEFAAALDRWGGDLEAWPAPQRAAAADLLPVSPEAARELAAMQAVEAAMARTGARVAASLDELVPRATASRQERAAGIAWRLRYAACLVLVAAGFAYGALSDGPRAPRPEDWFTPAFAAPSEPFDVD